MNVGHFFECGFVLNDYEEKYNQLNVDQRIFQNKILECLTKKENPLLKNEANIRNLVKFVQEYMDEEINFLIALLPTKSSRGASEHSHSKEQDCLIKLLIEISPIQTDMFRLLMEKIATYDTCGTEQDRMALNITMNVPTYIINQFRYQPKIEVPEQLCKELITFLSKLSFVYTKKEIIECFPDILGDSNHDNIVNDLECLLSDCELISAVMDTLSNLRFNNKENLTRIVNKLLGGDYYSKVKDEAAPHVIRFILKAASLLNSTNMLSQLRDKVRLDAIRDDHARLSIYTTISECLSISNQLAELYMAMLSKIYVVVDEDESQEEERAPADAVSFMPIDLAFVAIIYSIPQQLKQIDKLFKQMIKNDDEHVSSRLRVACESLLSLDARIRGELYEPIVSLMAKSLISSSQTSVSSAGSLVYKIAFEHYDYKHRQRLVAALVELLLTNSACARDNCLDVLVDLVANGGFADRRRETAAAAGAAAATAAVNPMCMFVAQLRPLLDYIDYFSIAQIRKIYYITCSVAYSSQNVLSSTLLLNASSSSSMMHHELQEDRSMLEMNDLSISCNSLHECLYALISKQLASRTLKQKQMGVVGALMLIINMNKTSSSKSPSSSRTSGAKAAAAAANDNSENEIFYDSFNSTPPSLIKLDDEMNGGTRGLLSRSSTECVNNNANLLNSLTSELKHIWQMIIECSKSSPESLGLFEDDLTSLLYKEAIPESIEHLLKENLKQMTSNLFRLNTELLTAPSKQQLLGSLKQGYEFGIDAHAKGALNLLPQIINYMQKRNVALLNNNENIDLRQSFAQQHKFAANMSPMAIASTFRLMAALERRNMNELKEYLGIPVLSIKREELIKLANSAHSNVDSSLLASGGASGLMNKFKNSLSDEERRIVCDLLFYMINWFIELVNAFSRLLSVRRAKQQQQPTNASRVDNETMTQKILFRVKCILELQSMLGRLLPHMGAHYRPPMAIFGLVESVDELPYVHTLIKKKEVKKNSTAKKGKATKRKATEGKEETKKKKKSIDKTKPSHLENEAENSCSLDGEHEGVYAEEKELVQNTDDDDDDKDDENNMENEVDLSKLSVYFREFDIELFGLINMPLELTPIIPDTADRESTSGNNNNSSKLEPASLLLIVGETNKKLTAILKSSSGSGAGTGFGFQQTKLTKLQLYTQMYPIEAVSLVAQLVDAHLSSACDHLNTIAQHVMKIQKKHDQIRDPHELYNSIRSIQTLKCFNQLLKMMTSIVTWLGSSVNCSNERSLKIADELIRHIACRVVAEKPSSQAEKKIEIYCFKYFERLHEIVLELNSAQCIVQIMSTLCNRIFVAKRTNNSNAGAFEKPMREKLCETCKKFLEYDYNPKFNLAINGNGSASANESLTSILNALIKNESDSLTLVESICQIINSDDFAEDRHACGKYSTLRTHFGCYYKCLLEYGIERLKSVERYDSTSMERNELIEKIMSDIRRLIGMHCDLIKLKKKNAGISFTDINVLIMIKNSRLFLNNFLKYCMPWLDQAFDTHKRQVVEMLQTLQVRFIFYSF
jgi:hypothetical protein